MSRILYYSMISVESRNPTMICFGDKVTTHRRFLRVETVVPPDNPPRGFSKNDSYPPASPNQIQLERRKRIIEAIISSVTEGLPTLTVPGHFRGQDTSEPGKPLFQFGYAPVDRANRRQIPVKSQTPTIRPDKTSPTREPIKLTKTLAHRLLESRQKKQGATPGKVRSIAPVF